MNTNTMTPPLDRNVGDETSDLWVLLHTTERKCKQADETCLTYAGHVEHTVTDVRRAVEGGYGYSTSSSSFADLMKALERRSVLTELRTELRWQYVRSLSRDDLAKTAEDYFTFNECSADEYSAAMVRRLSELVSS